MKATLSLAVLCLLGEVSAINLEKHHRHHQKHMIKSAEPGKFYPATRPGAKWFELDDPTERIHGTEHMDDQSPYDPEVGDAPEDLKRVGNDHEPLVNPKLSPTGYYNGFFHKDYQGNYSQRQVSVSKSNKRHHKHGKHHNHDHVHVQIKDHENDTDDLIEDGVAYVQLKDHENDTEDMPAGLDPYQLMQMKLVESQKQESQKWEEDYKKTEEDESFEFVQTQYDHENDTDDMPHGLDPIEDASPAVKSQFQLAQEQQNQEVQDIIDGSGEDLVQIRSQNMDYGLVNHSWSENSGIADDNDVQLRDYGTVAHGWSEQAGIEESNALQMKDYGTVVHGWGEQAGIEDSQDIFIQYESHEHDTEDIAEDMAPDMFDHHHSKMWNEMVAKKSLELEQTMKIEDNIEASKIKAKEEAERRAAIVKFNEEQEKKKKLALASTKNLKNGTLEQQRKVNPYKTIDLSEVYATMV